jgi:hypothetical protein
MVTDGERMANGDSDGWQLQLRHTTDNNYDGWWTLTAMDNGWHRTVTVMYGNGDK